MLFILLAKWIIKTACNIRKDVCRVIHKADNNHKAWVARHLIVSGLKNLYSGNDVHKEETEPYSLCCGSFTSLSSVQSWQSLYNNGPFQKYRHWLVRAVLCVSVKHSLMFWCLSNANKGECLNKTRCSHSSAPLPFHSLTSKRLGRRLDFPWKQHLTEKKEKPEQSFQHSVKQSGLRFLLTGLQQFNLDIARS